MISPDFIQPAQSIDRKRQLAEAMSGMPPGGPSAGGIGPGGMITQLLLGGLAGGDLGGSDALQGAAGGASVPFADMAGGDMGTAAPAPDFSGMAGGGMGAPAAPPGNDTMPGDQVQDFILKALMARLGG